MSDTPKKILELHEPDSPALPLVFDSPHSGTVYPDDFGYACDIKELRKLEDAHLDDLFAAAKQSKATLLCATFARSYIDPNRAIDDIDEHMLDDFWPEDLYTLSPTTRSKQGVGLIPRCIREGVPIYKRKLSVEEIKQRIQNYHVPYHKALEKLLNDAHKRHSKVWHINLHSMPSALACPKNSDKKRHHGRIRPSDIVLGDLDGNCCEPDFVKTLYDFWEELGYNVSINDPFKGAELIACYSRPEENRHSLQIEINRSLYMDEAKGRPNASYMRFKGHCTQMIELCAKYCKDRL